MEATSYKLEIGDPAPPFEDLPGVDGSTHSLADYEDAKALLVVFHCNHCPYAQAYESRLIQIHKEYRTRGVAVVAINPNDDKEYPEDSFDEMKRRAKSKGYTFDYLRDESQEVARAYGAQCTPHLLLFDEDGRLAYQGRFDGIKDDATRGNAQDVGDAIDAILAGKPVARPVTRAFGCSVKWTPENLARSIER